MADYYIYVQRNVQVLLLSVLEWDVLPGGGMWFGVWPTLEEATAWASLYGWAVTERTGYRLPDPIGDRFLQPRFNCFRWWQIIDAEGEALGVVAQPLDEEEVPTEERERWRVKLRKAAQEMLDGLDG